MFELEKIRNEKIHHKPENIDFLSCFFVENTIAYIDTPDKILEWLYNHSEKVGITK